MIETTAEDASPASRRSAPSRRALPWVANISTLFQEYAPADRPRRAADFGFSRIESWWPFATPAPAPTEIDAFIRTIDDAGAQLVAVNLYGGAPGRRGVLSHADRIDEFHASAAAASRVASALGTRLFNAPFGDLAPGVDPVDQRAIGVAALCDAIDTLPPGSRVLVEPLSAPHGDPATPAIRTVEQALDIVDSIERTGREGSAGVLLDVYHLAQNDEDLLRSIADAAGRTAHVQLADAPGRAEPSSGAIDFGTVLDALERSDYPGDVALEFFPADGDTHRALRRCLSALDRGTGR